MVEYIKEQDSLNTGRKIINEELTRSNNNADKAKIDSAEALLKAIASMNLSESIRNELNQIVIEGDSSVEAAQARVDEKGQTHPTLKQRIDDGFEKTTSQLNETNSQLAQTEKSLNLKKANAQIPLDIPTYHFGDNHAVHPAIKDFPTKKYGFEYVMAFTPYSESRDRYENPSIVVSDDRENWQVPNGLINPVIPQPDTGYHYSDPELFDNGTELEMWYRLTNKSNQHSKLLMVKTTDLINWTTPVTILEINQLDTAYISPTGFYSSGTYHLWYRDKNANYVYTSTTDLINWTTPEIVNYNFGVYSNFKCWHNEVRVIDGKYMSVSSAIGDGEYHLFLFESIDGKNFNLIKKIVEPSINGFDNWRIYKASLVKYGVWYYIYYSAFARDNSCHIGLTKASAATNIFSGYSMADKQFNDRYQMTTAIINGRNNEPVAFPNGVRIIGKGETRVTNAGVAGYRTQPQKPDTQTILTDGGTRLGYGEFAGIYLNSNKNDSIQGIHMGDGAMYLEKNSSRLSIHPEGTYRNSYARFLIVDINLASETFTVREGVDFIEGIESVTYGFKINFKNLPSGLHPYGECAVRSAGGLRLGETALTFTYSREIGPSHAIFGIKTNALATSHVDMSRITEGSVRVLVVY